MPHWLPYLALATASAAIFALALRAGRDRKLLALYISMAGAAYLFEFVIMVLLDSYEYLPGILADPYLDSLAGAIASDAFAVPMAAVGAVVFRLRAPGLLLVVAVIAAIEELFQALGVYRHHWWQTGYTAFFLLVGFLLAGRWHGLLQRRRPAWPVRIAVAFLLSLLVRTTANFLLRVPGLFFFAVGWFADPERGHIVFAALFVTAEAAVFAPLLCGHGSRLLPPVVLAFFCLVLVLLGRAGILVAPWWFPGLHLILSAVIFCLNYALVAWLGFSVRRRY